MDKHLVMMVHGVGEQSPGETVDEFVGALREELDVHSETHDTTVQIADPKKTKTGVLSLFPCHQRRMVANGREVILAEAHWADLSPAPSGVIGTAIDLLRLVLGLGYVALDNVQNSSAVPSAFVQKAVMAFVWIFYALVGPINLFLALGTAFLLVDPTITTFQQTPWLSEVGLGILGLATIGIGAGLATSAQALMQKVLGRGLQAIGFVTLLCAAAFWLNVDFSFAKMIVADCDMLDPANADTQVRCFVGFGIAALGGSWLLQVTLLIALSLYSFRGLFREIGDKNAIYIAICSAMLVFWMTFTVALWYLAVSATNNLPDTYPLKDILEDGFRQATTTLVYGVGALVAIGITGALVALVRVMRAGQLVGDTSATWLDRWFGRAILNPWINIVLFISALVLAGSAYFAFAKRLDEAPCVAGQMSGEIDLALPQLACTLDDIASSNFAIAISIIALIGFAIINLSQNIAGIVGVARDITTYLTRTSFYNPRTHPKRSAYVHAEDINRRFDLALTHMLDQEGRDRIKSITIMSHSQGTVVAAKRTIELAPDLPVKPLLVTMGSPLASIYGHYFDLNYKVTDAERAGLKDWINIYRTDDFVGTQIKDNGMQADNIALRPRGHSHYWSDTFVWDVFRKKGIFD